MPPGGAALAIYIATMVIEQAVPILRDALTKPDKYDAMTPEEIKALLTPRPWEELEAAARLGLSPGDITP